MRYQLLELAAFNFDIHYTRIVPELDFTCGRFDRVAEGAGTVNQAAFFGLVAGPHPALPNFVDFFRRSLARNSGFRCEIGIDVADSGLHDFGKTWIEPATRVVCAAQPRGGHAAGADGELFHCLFTGRQHREYADGSGHGGRISDDFVSRHRDPVAARCGNVAHRHHDRLAGFTGELEFTPDQFGSICAATRRIHA